MSKVQAEPNRRNQNIRASSSLLVGPETLMFAQTSNLMRSVNHGFAFDRADGSWVLTLRDGGMAIVGGGK